jgi:hypothetical protein
MYNMNMNQTPWPQQLQLDAPSVTKARFRDSPLTHSRGESHNSHTLVRINVPSVGVGEFRGQPTYRGSLDSIELIPKVDVLEQARSTTDTTIPPVQIRGWLMGGSVTPPRRACWREVAFGVCRSISKSFFVRSPPLDVSLKSSEQSMSKPYMSSI